MCSNRICISDLSTCGLVISLCAINWSGKETLDLPDDIVFGVQRRWDGHPGQDPGKAWVENFRLSNLFTCHFPDVLNCFFPIFTIPKEKEYSFDVSENNIDSAS